ncbi:MAG: FMN-binding protein [Clostridia bacterium]|nr:FMN-binding protein [Clostridia bacterium]MBN2882635.1 FMN-binding protein [Clostridia bacterium]
MKKRIVIILVTVLLIILAAGIILINKIESDLESLKYFDIQEVDMSLIQDGVYCGSYAAVPVSVEVYVTVKDHLITDIHITRHINGQGTPAEVIIDSVIESQSLQVDLITGATYSSKVILLAIDNALRSKKEQ